MVICKNFYSTLTCYNVIFGLVYSLVTKKNPPEVDIAAPKKSHIDN